MAVAAYTSLVSLTHVLDNLHYRAQLQCPRLDIRLIQTLQESVHFLLDFVEAHSIRKLEGIDALWSKIANVAFEAEDSIDFHVVNELRGASQETPFEVSFSTFGQDMQKVIEKIVLIKKEIQADEEEGEDRRARIQPSVYVPIDASLSTASSGRSIMVGFDKHMVVILDVLTRGKSHLQIFPIVGPGGIGKTTLTKYIFDRPLIRDHFDIHIWITISQVYDIQKILRDALNEQENERNGESVAQLGQRLYQKLIGRRYLIVMDDVWSTEILDDLRMFFPKNDDGSWIIITTRLLEVAKYLGSHPPYLIDFLNNDESWKLFCQIVFAQDDCPHVELKLLGKKIVESCGGLPLLINVIGGFLAKSNMTKIFWESVKENVIDLGSSENDEYCYRSLSLSYDNLPIHLKPCFLYMRVYSEDAEINVSKLVKLWIAEGFIKLVRDKSLEEIAREHVNDLIDRNLIFVRRRKISGEIESCGIHDLLRDLCIRNSAKECFIYSARVQHRREVLLYPSNMRVCFLCSERSTNMEPINVTEFVHYLPSTSEVCLFLCDACRKVCSHIRRLKLLRAIDVGASDFFQPSGLRYASIECSSNFQFVSPSSLHLLWNLQTLKIDASSGMFAPVLPSQIWEMPQLRHLEVNDFVLPNPEVTHAEGGDFVILKNIRTLFGIKDFICTKDILDRIPNVNELRISASYLLCDLTQLHELESLSIDIGWKNFVFPESLKKLVLMKCLIRWEEMTIIGSLPNLEEFTMHRSGQGRKREWDPIEGEFRRLKGLSFEFYNVVWRASPECFPKLEWLMLKGLLDFEIPLDVGCMDTLRSINLYGCGERVVESAMKIWKEHRDMDNEKLQIHIGGAYGADQLVDPSSLEELKTLNRILKARMITISL